MATTKRPPSNKVLEGRLVKRASTVRATTTERDGLICELRARGLTFRAIGGLAGLSHTQVGNIVKSHKESEEEAA